MLLDSLNYSLTFYQKHQTTRDERLDRANPGDDGDVAKIYVILQQMWAPGCFPGAVFMGEVAPFPEIQSMYCSGSHGRQPAASIDHSFQRFS